MSIIIGIVLTYLTALVFPEEMPFSLDFKMVVLYAIILLVVSVFGSIVSARRVTKIDPLTAIRESGINDWFSIKKRNKII